MPPLHHSGFAEQCLGLGKEIRNRLHLPPELQELRPKRRHRLDVHRRLRPDTDPRCPRASLISPAGAIRASTFNRTSRRSATASNPTTSIATSFVLASLLVVDAPLHDDHAIHHQKFPRVRVHRVERDDLARARHVPRSRRTPSARPSSSSSASTTTRSRRRRRSRRRAAARARSARSPSFAAAGRASPSADAPTRTARASPSRASAARSSRTPRPPESRDGAAAPRRQPRAHQDRRSTPARAACPPAASAPT